jgi:hypothetical protein
MGVGQATKEHQYCSSLHGCEIPLQNSKDSGVRFFSFSTLLSRSNPIDIALRFGCTDSYIAVNVTKIKVKPGMRALLIVNNLSPIEKETSKRES